MLCLYFFFNDTATTEIYTLSLHDALPISSYFGSNVQSSPCGISVPTVAYIGSSRAGESRPAKARGRRRRAGDRKSTRLNSSHANISYAVFCLKKKKDKTHHQYRPHERPHT